MEKNDGKIFTISLSLSRVRKHLCRFSSRQFRQKIHRSFGFLALLVSPCYLYLPVTPRFSFLRPLRPRFACPPLSYRHFFEMPSPHLPPPSAENGSTIFHKMSGNKNSGEEGERRGQQRRRVERMKLYSNDGVRTLFLPPRPLLVDEASNGIYERRCSREMSPVFKALLKEYSHEPGRALFMSRTRVRNVHGRTRKADRGEAHVSSLERTGWNQVSYP